MKLLKNLIVAAAALVAVTIAVPNLEAQTVSYFGTLTGGTNAVAAASTNTYYQVVFTTNVVSGVSTTIVSSVSSSALGPAIMNSRYISVQPEFSLMSGIGGATSNVTFRIDGSVDGAIWNIGVSNITVAASTGTNNVGYAIIDTGGAIFWRVGIIGNTNFFILTNVACPFGKKTYL